MARSISAPAIRRPTHDALAVVTDPWTRPATSGSTRTSQSAAVAPRTVRRHADSHHAVGECLRSVGRPPTQVSSTPASSPSTPVTVPSGLDESGKDRHRLLQTVVSRQQAVLVLDRHGAVVADVRAARRRCHPTPVRRGRGRSCGTARPARPTSAAGRVSRTPLTAIRSATREVSLASTWTMARVRARWRMAADGIDALPEQVARVEVGGDRRAAARRGGAAGSPGCRRRTRDASRCRR